METIKLHQFAEKLELLGYSRRCIEDYPYAVGRFFKYLSEHEHIESIDAVTKEHLTAYHTYLQFGRLQNGKHLANRSVTFYLEPLKTFYRIMHQEGLLAHDLSPVIITPKRHMQLPRHVPASGAITALLNAVDGKDSISRRDRCILELFYATGIRSQELRTITVDDYNRTEATLLIHGKGAKDRIVPVGWWMVAYLEEYLHYVRPTLIRTKTNLMFISKGGSALQRNVVGYIVTKYAKKAGLDTVTPHTLRHACATHLLQNGADIRYVQELLGHAYLSSTQIYTRVDISYLKKAHAQYHPRECGCDET